MNGLKTVINYDGEYDEKYLVRKGDYLIGMDGEFRCYEWKGMDALLNQRVCRLQDFSSLLDTKFLFYGINKYLKDIEDVTSFTTVKHISAKQIKAIEFPFPPITEQKYIVTILDQVFADIEQARAKTEQNLKNAQELFESYLQQIFSHPGEGWTEGKLLTFCEKITVGHVGSMASKYLDDGIIFLRSQNIRPFNVSLKGCKFIDEEFNNKLKKSQLTPGDVAIVRTGYPGTAAVIPESLPISNCSDLVIVKTKPSLSPHFLTLFLNSCFGKSLVSANLVGAAQKHFNVTAAKNVMFAAPNIDEQEKIVSSAHLFRLEIMKVENIYIRKLDTLNELKKSILQKAFAGELSKSNA